MSDDGGGSSEVQGQPTSFDRVKDLRQELTELKVERDSFSKKQVDARDPGYQHVLERIGETEQQIRLHRPGVDPSSPEGEKQWQAETVRNEIEVLEANRASRVENERAADNHDKDPLNHERRLREIDSDIADRKIRLRSLEQPDDAANPNEVGDDVELLGALGETTVSARQHLDWEKKQKEAADEAARRDIAKAAGAVGAGLQEAQRGDLERAVMEQAGESPDYPALMDNARASDDMTEKNGCTPRVLAGISAGVVIAAILVVAALVFGGDDKKTATGSCNALGSSAGELAAPVQDDCPEDTPTDGSTPGATGDGGDLSSFAGHYVLTEGLDNPNGHDTQPLDSPPWEITVQPASASFDVDESGTITGGTIHTSMIAVSAEIGECPYSLDGDQASGMLTLSGPGATGQILWEGGITASGPCSSEMDMARGAKLGIVGNDVVLCYIAMGPDLASCTGGDTRVAGRFTRQ